MGGAGGKAEYLVNGLFANAPKLGPHEVAVLVDHMKWQSWWTTSKASFNVPQSRSNTFRVGRWGLGRS